MSNTNSNDKSECSEIYYIVERFENISEAWAKGIRSRLGIALLIKWEGYSSKDNSWEPVENLSLDHSINQLHALVKKSSMKNSKKKKNLIHKAIQFLEKKKIKFQKKKLLYSIQHKSEINQINHKIEEDVYSKEHNDKSEELNQIMYKRRNMRKERLEISSRNDEKKEKKQTMRQKLPGDLFAFEFQKKNDKEQAQNLICAMLDEADIKSSISQKKITTKKKLIYSPNHANSINDTLQEKLLLKSCPKEIKDISFELDNEIFHNQIEGNIADNNINEIYDQDKRRYSLEIDQQDQKESSLNLELDDEQDNDINNNDNNDDDNDDDKIQKRVLYQPKEYIFSEGKDKHKPENSNTNNLTSNNCIKNEKDDKLMEDNNSTEINEKNHETSQLYDQKMSKNLFAKKYNKKIFKLFHFKNPFKSLETKLTFQNDFLKKCFLSDKKNKNILFTKRDNNKFIKSEEINISDQNNIKCLRERVCQLKSHICHDKSLEQLIEHNCEYYFNIIQNIFQNNSVRKINYIKTNSNLIQNISFKQFIYNQSDLSSDDTSIKIIPSSFYLIKITDQNEICMWEEFNYLENYFKHKKAECLSSANLVKSVFQTNKKIFSCENNKNLINHSYNNNANNNHLHRYGSLKKLEQDNFVNDFHQKSSYKLIQLIEKLETTKDDVNSFDDSFKTYSCEES